MDDKEARMAHLREQVHSLSDSNLRAAEHSENSELNFTESVSYLRTVRRLGEAWTRQRRDEVPDVIASQVEQVLRAAAATVHGMLNFNVETSDAHRVATQLRNDAEQVYNQMREYRPHLRAEVDAEVVISRLEARLNAVAAMEERVNALSNEAQALVDRASNLSAELAAADLSKYYDDQATKHRDTSATFLKAAGLAGLATGIAAAIAFATLGANADADWAAYVRDLGVRVFVLGLGVYAASFFIRSYRANQHLRVVNEHKANALKTFLLFQASAAEDSGARDLITAELVKAVFAADQTGFLDNAPDRTVVDGQAGLLAMLSQQRQTPNA